MKPWTQRTTFRIIAASGALTLSPYLYETGDISLRDLFSLRLYLYLAWILLPTALLLIASRICRDLPWMQRFIAISAMILALFVGGTAWYEIANHITGRGTFGVTPALLAMFVAPLGAAAVLFAAIVSSIRRPQRVD